MMKKYRISQFFGFFSAALIANISKLMKMDISFCIHTCIHTCKQPKTDMFASKYYVITCILIFYTPLLIIFYFSDFVCIVHNKNFVSGQLPTRTIPHHTGIGPNEWFYWLVVVLVGSCLSGELSRDRGPGGQLQLSFIFIQWGIVLEPKLILLLSTVIVRQHPKCPFFSCLKSHAQFCLGKGILIEMKVNFLMEGERKLP